LRVVLPPELERKTNAPPPLHTTVARPKRRLPPEVLTDAEVCALMQACGHYTAIGLRDRALIALLYRAGLRINEALSLYPKDLDLEGGSVRVLNGKGGKSRTVGLDPGAAAVIERWLDARSRLELGGRHPVFCTLRGHAMADAYVRVLLKRLAARAGIEKRVHAHGLRHTHAAQLRAEGVDIAIISRQLGHASITTTARYLDHLAPRAVIEAMRMRTWTGA
jgi:site-specific recombinase XerD